MKFTAEDFDLCNPSGDWARAEVNAMAMNQANAKLQAWLDEHQTLYNTQDKNGKWKYWWRDENMSNPRETHMGTLVCIKEIEHG